jgi:hypothetical protein
LSLDSVFVKDKKNLKVCRYVVVEKKQHKIFFEIYQCYIQNKN